ncbi:uncharacterized protein LTR77_002052 [Saxophila tyrrhenica]|uniref:Condensin complex subunit 2 n=1 Tax=Saxophila tyrrhenica TaxID=1690608 RepID=A0AAV9PMB1_9PEZI|nr:hypothetical protein LTR77_002052 [Saxophila tyrrhenica]
MPRVRAGKQSAAANTTYDSPVKTVQIALNDDRAEKAQRLQSRHALHSKQMDAYKAAASPVRKRKSLGADTGGPETPSQQDAGDYNVLGPGVTPMKRVPILANFEEWMKMATDNKINATNSWNFALIDYFHDMSLLREGDSVNFQKASCTLDGCVKIYTSRVDSVATETGKLLSGLAESKSDKKRRGGAEGEEGEDEDKEGEEGEDGAAKKKGKKKARNAEATLVNSFDQLKLKKMELEFSVDPLFKKASADFDEGGAKGLLLNHLSIDGEGRIVFDSSNDAKETDGEENRRDSMEPEGEEEEGEQKQSEEPAVEDDRPVDIAALGARFFPDLSMLDNKDICPTLKTFELGSGDASLDLPFLKAPENWRDEQPEPSSEEAGENSVLPDNNFGIGDDDDNGFDLPPETGFGEGGEAWARDAALQPQMRVVDAYGGAEAGEEGGEVGTFDTNSNVYGVTLQHRSLGDDQENILNYFDTALHKNWAGPEHWKIARIKEANRSAAQDKEKKARKEKEPFEIDFAAPMSQELAAQLYTTASSNAAISLPRKEWRSRTRNLLPDDKHFNSKDLLKLFLKPKARLGARKAIGGRRDGGVEGEVDEAYWATASHAPPTHPDDVDAVQGDYDANFFADDALPLPAGVDPDDDDDFADAREQFSPGIADEIDAGGPTGPGIDGILAGSQEQGEGAFGANLVAQSRRLRPEYVQYARVAKKVDVRRLKEEMWRGCGFGKDEVSLHFLEVRSPRLGILMAWQANIIHVRPKIADNRASRPLCRTQAANRVISTTVGDHVGIPPAALPPQTPSKPQPPAVLQDDSGALKFTDIMNNLHHVYPKQQLADISTSYGFICLLHLANEKGLVIENVDGWSDLTVRKDLEAIIGEGGD